MPEPVRVRVVRGNPTEAELAALVSVLLHRAAGAAAAGPEPPPRSRWRAALPGG